MIETQKSNRWNLGSPLSEKPSTRTHGPLSAIQKQFSWARVFILAGVAISQLTLADDHNKSPLDIIDQMGATLPWLIERFENYDGDRNAALSTVDADLKSIGRKGIRIFSHSFTKKRSRYCHAQTRRGNVELLSKD